MGKELFGAPPPIIVPSGTFLDIKLASSYNAASKMEVHSFWMSFLIIILRYLSISSLKKSDLCNKV